MQNLCTHNLTNAVTEALLRIAIRTLNENFIPIRNRTNYYSLCYPLKWPNFPRYFHEDTIYTCENSFRGEVSLYEDDNH